MAKATKSGLWGGQVRCDFERVSQKVPRLKDVMAGLVPAIHVFGAANAMGQQQGTKSFVPVSLCRRRRHAGPIFGRCGVDGRDKPGHDGRNRGADKKSDNS